jgi:hypothetical protein
VTYFVSEKQKEKEKEKKMPYFELDKKNWNEFIS